MMCPIFFGGGFLRYHRINAIIATINAAIAIPNPTIEHYRQSYTQIRRFSDYRSTGHKIVTYCYHTVKTYKTLFTLILHKL